MSKKASLVKLSLKSVFIQLALLLLFSHLHSQTNRANKWVFGVKAGLDFSGGAPVGYGPTAIHSINENSSMVSDEFGNLLFYTSGDTVWDKSHTPMPNGIGLTGNRSSSQGVLVSPVVGTCDKYYIFTGIAFEQIAAPPGLRYSIVDMSLQGNGTGACPLGDVVVASKNTHLTLPPLKDSLDEKVTSVMHANGVDYWIIVREFATNNYYSYLVTAAGVNPLPVISTTGLGQGVAGYMKPSKDGTQIVSARLLYGGALGPLPGYVELIDFNNTTGVLSGAQVINAGINHNYYGVSFSCDDSLIYVTGGNSSNVFLYQYQRYAPIISATEVIVDTISYLSPLQLGLDGKIYMPDFGFNTLSVINTPNSLATPNYTQSSLTILAGTKGMIGMPNIFHGYEREFCVPFNSVKSFTICSGDSATLGESFYTSCHNYNWLPTAGLANATVHNPVAMPTVTTTYTVNVSTLNCDTYTDTFRVVVIPTPAASITGDLDICAGGNTSLSATAGGITYNWSTGATTDVISVAPSTTTNYSVTISTGGLCPSIAAVTVSVTPLPSASINGSNRLCIGDSITLHTLSSDSVLWSTGSGDSSITVSPALNTTYYLIATNVCGSDTDSIAITVHPLPISTCPSNDTICVGETILLSVSGANSYTWFPAMGISSTTGNNVSASPAVNTSYTITGTDANACSSSCETSITVVPLPSVSAGANQTIQEGNSVQLSASGATNYLWSPAEGLTCVTCSNPIANPSVTTAYYVTTLDANGCSATDSLIVTVEIICGDIFIPNAFSPNGDGENDVYYVYANASCVKNFLLRIYNRWGEIVFETRDIKQGWDGVYKDNPLNAAVFTYNVVIESADNTTFSKSGNVTLIR